MEGRRGEVEEQGFRVSSKQLVIDCKRLGGILSPDFYLLYATYSLIVYSLSA